MYETPHDILNKIRIRQNSISRKQKEAEDDVAKALYTLSFEICETEKLLTSIIVAMGRK